MKITDYGGALAANKRLLAAATAGLPHGERCLIAAQAMLETTHMALGQRDTSKDHLVASGAANVSVLNLNMDMLKMLGYSGDWGYLNRAEGLGTVVGLLVRGFRLWGVDKTLAFVRGGRSAFHDLRSYGAQEYIRIIREMAGVIERDSALLTDGRRVEVFLEHV